MVYAEFGGQTECIMGNWKVENRFSKIVKFHRDLFQIEVKRIRFSFFFLKKCRTETFPYRRHGTFVRKPLVFLYLCKRASSLSVV